MGAAPLLPQAQHGIDPVAGRFLGDVVTGPSHDVSSKPRRQSPGLIVGTFTTGLPARRCSSSSRGGALAASPN